MVNGVASVLSRLWTLADAFSFGGVNRVRDHAFAVDATVI